MLRTLSIRDFVIVDRLDLEFAPGFTVLTGETGAGKSILIDALALVLGERSDAGMVREGCARAEISAEFSLDGLPRVQTWLEANDLADEGRAFACCVACWRAAVVRAPTSMAARARCSRSRSSARSWSISMASTSISRCCALPAQRELLDAYAGADRARRRGGRRPGATGRSCGASAWSGRRTPQALAAEREQSQWQVQELTRLGFLCRRMGDAAGRSSAVGACRQPVRDGRIRDRGAVGRRGGGVGHGQWRGLAPATLRRAYDPALKESLDVLEPGADPDPGSGVQPASLPQRLDLDPRTTARGRAAARGRAQRRAQVPRHPGAHSRDCWRSFERRLRRTRRRGEPGGSWRSREQQARADLSRGCAQTLSARSAQRAARSSPSR